MTANKISKTLEQIKQEANFIDLMSTNFADFSAKFPYAVISDEIKGYFKNHVYLPDPKGLLTARKAIAQFYQTRGTTVDPEQIFVTASTSESYQLLFQALTKPGDNILLPNPGYPLFEYLARFKSLESRLYQLDFSKDWQIDLDSIISQLDNRSKILVLISPNNPTGAVVSQEQLKAVSEIALRNKLNIIADEVFAEYLYGNSLPRITNIAKDLPVFTLNGISKMLALPDLKLAWIAATGKNINPIVDQLETINDVFLNANYLSQTILPTLFKEMPNIQKPILDNLRINHKSLKTIFSKAEFIKFNQPAGGIHCLLRIRKSLKNYQLSEEDFVLKLLNDLHVNVHPGYFYDYQDQRAQYFHIVISLLQQTNLFKQALKRLAKFIG